MPDRHKQGRAEVRIAVAVGLAVGFAAVPFAKSGRATTDDKATAQKKVELTALTFDEFQKKVLTNPKAKVTIVDAWATWCGTCKENFPHLVELHRKYADKGLACVSLSMDDSTDGKAVADALKFLREKEAMFTNVVLKEEPDVSFETLKLAAIPAVLMYGPDGKELRRFTLEDVDNQFTYEQVEQAVKEVLGVK